ncbi:MAG: hypothetical protein GEV05_27060 [Betaproteobacteria bacterium]|nr:hypothetical protein [Betaproteobacteria bacterium]
MKFNLTLSRWHKVAERMSAALKEREAKVKAAFTATTISAWNKQGIEDKAADIARRAAEDVALIELGTHAVAHIRAALAVRNAELGVSARLAEAESAKRCAALYKAVLDGQKADMVRPDGVCALPADAGVEAEGFFGRRAAASIALQIADTAMLASLREKLAREEARAMRLLDEVADLNRDKLELDVSDGVLQVAGLAQ